jgi:hypothetical protein
MPTKTVAPAKAASKAAAEEDAEVMARIECAGDPARAARVAERHQLLGSLIGMWSYDVLTDIDRDAIRTLNAIAWCVSHGNAERMQEIGEAVRSAMSTKKSEAHRTLQRRASAAVAVLAEYVRGDETKKLAARDSTMAVLAVLARHPDAFPSTDMSDDANERAYAAVKKTLRECAMKGNPPMGPVLKAWGCSERTVNAALRNVQRG